MSANKTSPDEDLRRQAEPNVVATRCSWDVPGFETCVNAEVNRLRAAGTRDKAS